MALLAVEGFDHYSAAADIDDVDLWYTESFDTACTLQTGRDGTGQCMRITTDNRRFQATLSSNETTLIAGFAYKYDILYGEEFFAFKDNNTIQVRLWHVATGAIEARNGAGTSIGTSATTPIRAGVWHYIEVKATIGNSPNGAIEVKVDGETVLSETSVDTQYTANSYTNGCMWYGASGDNYFDDIYIANTSGTVNNTYLGDCKVQTLYPSANGVSDGMDWTASAGSNYQCVDDPLSDADDVSSSTVNAIDRYAFDNLPAGPDTVYGLQITARATKDDTGTRSIALEAVDDPSGTPVVQTSSNKALTYPDLAYHTEMFHTSDAGETNLWTTSEINAAEIGIKVTV